MLFDLDRIFKTLCTLLYSTSSAHSSDSQIGGSTVLRQPIHQIVRLGVLSVPRKWPRVLATSLEPSRSIRLLSRFVTYQTNKKLPGSNPLVGFLAHVRAADTYTELIELAFKTNRLLKGIGERLRKTSQDKRHY